MNATIGPLGLVLSALTIVILISVLRSLFRWRKATSFYVDGIHKDTAKRITVRIDIRVLRSDIHSSLEARKIGKEIQQTLAYGSACAASKDLPDKLSDLDDSAHEQELQ